MKPVQIGNFLVGDGHPCLIVAEAGVNHCGDLNIAIELINAAAKVGVDAIKFQCFITDNLVAKQTPKALYQMGQGEKNSTQYDMLKSLELSLDQHLKLQSHCKDKGIMYICTPYDNKSLDFLQKTNSTPVFKIASTDTNNFPFLKDIAKTQLPVILSTGMSSLGEVEKAVDTLKNNGLEDKLVILQCTSEYPAPYNELNLRAMETMKQAFFCPVGFSDHTYGIEVCSWAVAMGACVIEKHFTLDRSMPGPDHISSIEPKDLEKLVNIIRNTEKALGDGIKKIMPCEIDNKAKMQKSLIANQNIQIGQKIKAQDLICKRPGYGLSPIWFDRIIGKVSLNNIPEGKIITLNDIDWRNQTK